MLTLIRDRKQNWINPLSITSPLNLASAFIFQSFPELHVFLTELAPPRLNSLIVLAGAIYECWAAIVIFTK